MHELLDVVCGLGEVGQPLLELVRGCHPVIGVDVDPVTTKSPIRTFHVCYPYGFDDFVATTARYIERYRPELTIIHSTVRVGTTRAIFEKSGGRVAYSPIRGKHAKMKSDLRFYTKYVGGVEPEGAAAAQERLESYGLKVAALPSAEAAELGKLVETSYFAQLIAWAQEVERYCDQFQLSYDDVVSLCDEIPFFPPVRYFPGVMGGHCVKPNIALLKQAVGATPILDAIDDSDRQKREREAGLAKKPETSDLKDNRCLPAATRHLS